jgi:hypothetical protein
MDMGLERMMIRMVFVLLLAGACVPSQGCRAQGLIDTLRRAPADTSRLSMDSTAANNPVIPVTPVKPAKFTPNPKKAGLYSSIVPGLGQLYNHEYWKVPVVYAGIGIAAYFVSHNLNNYQSYRQAYIGRINNPNPTDKYVNIYTTTQLQQLQGDYSKYLDLTVLFTFIGYSLQVMDAVTSAHLKNFDISRDISMRLMPTLVPNGGGMAMVVNFK